MDAPTCIDGNGDRPVGITSTAQDLKSHNGMHTDSVIRCDSCMADKTEERRDNFGDDRDNDTNRMAARSDDEGRQTTGQSHVTVNKVNNEPCVVTDNGVIETVNAVTTRGHAANTCGLAKSTEQRHINDRDTQAEQPAVTETDTFVETMRELGGIDISNHADGDNMDCQNASEFAHEQKTDPSLQHLWVKAEKGSLAVNVIDGLLYRKVPVNVSSLHDHALVVTNKFQCNLIHINHSSPLSGHQGIRKTYLHLAALFYFPKMRNKVKQYIRCCKSCQKIAPKRQKKRQPLRELYMMATHVFNDVARYCRWSAAQNNTK